MNPSVVIDNLGYLLVGAWPDGPVGGLALTLILPPSMRVTGLGIGKPDPPGGLQSAVVSPDPNCWQAHFTPPSDRAGRGLEESALHGFGKLARAST